MVCDKLNIMLDLDWKVLLHLSAIVYLKKLKITGN